MKRFKRKEIFSQVGDTQYIIHPSKEKRGKKVGEVTVGKAVIRISMSNLPPFVGPNLAEKMIRAAANFQGVTLAGTPREPLTLIITAKTECKPTDTYIEEAGKRIVDSKIQAIACKVTKRIFSVVGVEFAKQVGRLADMNDFLDYCISRERSYFEKALYLPKEK